MADDKTTKTPEQPVTDSGPGKETPPAPPKEPEKVSVSPEPEKKTEPEVKTNVTNLAANPPRHQKR